MRLRSGWRRRVRSLANDKARTPWSRLVLGRVLSRAVLDLLPFWDSWCWWGVAFSRGSRDWQCVRRRSTRWSFFRSRGSRCRYFFFVLRGCRSLRRVPLDAQKIVSSVAAAISSYRRKLLAVPFDDDAGSHLNRIRRPDTGSGVRCVFNRGSGAVGLTFRILPRNLGHGPHRPSWFEFTPVHAMCIGDTPVEFSYLGT
jgi:hypothetical protein